MALATLTSYQGQDRNDHAALRPQKYPYAREYMGDQAVVVAGLEPQAVGRRGDSELGALAMLWVELTDSWGQANTEGGFGAFGRPGHDLKRFRICVGVDVYA